MQEGRLGCQLQEHILRRQEEVPSVVQMKYLLTFALFCHRGTSRPDKW